VRIPVYSLRTGILTQLAFLIIAAMLLINVAMVKFSEKDLIQARIHSATLLIHALEQGIGPALFQNENGIDSRVSTGRLQRGLTRLLEVGELSEIVVVDSSGDLIFSAGASREWEDQALSLARKALRSGMWSMKFRGKTWGVVWLNHAELNISAPLVYENRTRGGIEIGIPLKTVYRTLRESQKVILLYILLDTLILAIVGIYLLSRIVVKPIHKLLKMTAEYNEGQRIPLLKDTPRNEIGELSRSLNNMLKRLAENKEDLKAHIDSLERANKEIQEAQNEIIRSEKLASVGRLAAGVAHEIGNPIGIVLGYLDLLNGNGLTDEERKDFLDRMETEIRRVHEIIRQLLDFSRASSGLPEEIDVHGVLSKTLDILKPQPMMEDVVIDLRLEASKQRVLADPGQLQQVFLNIIMNAADALVGGAFPQGEGKAKTLVIESRNVENTIEMYFSDNGPGTTKEDLDRIFDPFFTTKDPGKGTGLGLSVSYRIIEALGGRIRAKSDEGEGTTITVALPLMGFKD
jgi:signal transduction histidine kinase